MTERSLLYTPLPLPALGDVAEEQVVREFRRVGDWALDVNLRLDSRPPWDGAGCPADQGRIPYYDCADGAFKPSVLYYDSSPPSQPAYPAILSGADFIFTYDAAIAFLAEGNAEAIGGLGHISQAPGLLLLVGTVDIDQWENLATRRPLAIGGSAVVIDAGNSLNLRLPGVGAYEHGYDLQLSSDGSSVLAAPNPPPDFLVEDLSSDDGTILLAGTGIVAWTVFPETGAVQPDQLEVIIPNGTAAGRLEVLIKIRVLNSSTRTGQIDIGFGYNGAAPAVDDYSSFQIPAAFAGALDVVKDYTIPADLTADVPITVWFRGSGDHTQFSLETDAAEGDHRLEAKISYGGGGSPGVTDHQLLTNRDPAGGGAHLAASISYDNTSSGLTASDVQAAIDEIETDRDTSGQGGWVKVADTTVIAADSTFKDIAPATYTAMAGNRNAGVTVQDGRISLTYYPRRKITLHLALSFESDTADRNFRVAFRNNLSAASTQLAGTAEVYAPAANQMVHVHCSGAGKIEDAFAWYAVIRTTGGTTANITIRAVSFWLEYE